MISSSPESRIAASKRPATQHVMTQEWKHLLFLHWRIDPALIQKRLPEGLTVDCFDGSAWIGIVPFFMRNVRPRFCPNVPGLSHFLELNLRTYVVDRNGEPGVWFFSLDCNQPIATWTAQTFFHLPYRHAEMEAVFKNDHINYRSTRRGDTQQQHFTYPSQANNAQPATPESLEHFLLERYRLFCLKKGTIYSGLVHHSCYKYQPTDIQEYSTRLLSLNGFSEPATPPESALLAHPVSVDIHPLQKVI